MLSCLPDLLLLLLLVIKNGCGTMTTDHFLWCWCALQLLLMLCGFSYGCAMGLSSLLLHDLQIVECLQ